MNPSAINEINEMDEMDEINDNENLSWNTRWKRRTVHQRKAAALVS